jgi:hypothetical protein
MISIDCTLLRLLGIPEGHVGGPLNRRMPLKHLPVWIILIARVRRMMTWRRRPMRHGRLALVEAAPLGGPGHILLVLGVLLMRRIHHEMREKG